MCEIYESLRSKILDHGWAVLHVGADPVDETPPFSYSVGMCLIDGYEIFSEKIQDDLAIYLINQIGKRLPSKGISVDHSCIIKGLVQDDYPIALIKTDDPMLKTEKTIMVQEVIDVEDYAVLQLVIPDSSGRFPWDKDYDEDMGEQEIYSDDFSQSLLSDYMNSLPVYNLCQIVPQGETRH